MVGVTSLARSGELGAEEPVGRARHREQVSARRARSLAPEHRAARVYGGGQTAEGGRRRVDGAGWTADSGWRRREDGAGSGWSALRPWTALREECGAARSARRVRRCALRAAQCAKSAELREECGAARRVRSRAKSAELRAVHEECGAARSAVREECGAARSARRVRSCALRNARRVRSCAQCAVRGGGEWAGLPLNDAQRYLGALCATALGDCVAGTALRTSWPRRGGAARTCRANARALPVASGPRAWSGSAPRRARPRALE